MSTLLRAGDPTAAGMDPACVGRIRERAASWVAEGITPALVVLAARRGVVCLHEAFGQLTPEPDSPPLRPDTIYPVASISKPFAATAVLCLVEAGLLGLDRPVQQYVPEFAGEGKDAVMVHHLLTHTSGLRDEVVEAHVRRALEAGTIPPDRRSEPASLALFPPYVMYWHFEAGLGAPLVGRPGEEAVYSSYGYALLGEIVRRVSGHSFADVCRERIFAPLGLRDTYFEVPEAEWDRVVRRPASFPGPHLNVRERITAAMPQGGLSSTAWDLAVFGQAFLNGGSYGGAQLLSTASVAQMTHNQIPGVPGSWLGERVPEGYRGLGWSVYGPRRTGRSPGQLSDRAFGHGGAGGSLLCIDPALELVVVWLSVGREEPPANQHAFIDALVDCTADR